MRAQLVSLSPLAKGLVHMILFFLAAILYLAALFGLGEQSLPGPLRPETDYFLFEEMPLSTASIFWAVASLSAAVLGFCYGVVSALLYNVSARLVGGEVGRVRLRELERAATPAEVGLRRMVSDQAQG